MKEMKHRLLFLLTVLMFMTLDVAGQEAYGQNGILIDGVILSKDDKKPVPFVHVVNLNSQQGTASNLQGRFSITMSSADSLMFSAIGFDKYVFALRDDVAVSRLDITIEMNTNSMELETVDIFAYKDEYALKRAILEMEVVAAPEQQRMQLPGFYYGPRKEVKPGIATNPISFVYSKLSKEAREIKKYSEVQKEYNSWYNEVFMKYNPVLVQELTELPQEDVDDFMRFCKLDDKFIRLHNEYDVVVAINKCLEDYLKAEKVQLDN